MDILKTNQKLLLALHHLELIRAESNIAMEGDLELAIELIKQALEQNQGDKNGRDEIRKAGP